MRMLCVFALLLASCVQSLTLPTDDPYEQHILAETARFAKLLNVKVTAEVVDDVYMVASSDGLSKVPAAGWYNDGKIKYWWSWLGNAALSMVPPSRRTRYATHRR